LDSTILDDAVATQDTVTQIIAAIRRVAREVPGADVVLAAQARAHDYTQVGKPRIAWDDEAARAELVDALVGDAHRILGHLPDQELGPRAAEAVGLLALVAGQDVEPAQDSDGTDGRWRIARRTAPERVISTVDPDTRHAHKTRQRHQDGYRAHLVVEPDTGIITATALTPAAGPHNSDAAVGIELLDRDRSLPDTCGERAGEAADRCWCRCSPTPLTPPGTCSPNSTRPGCGRSSNPGRYARPSRAGSPSTTSPLTRPQDW
jgi:hypothetical protein